MKKIPLSVILMAHNEEETIGQEVKNYYHEIVKKIPGSEMIIVDDGNTDNTGNILHSLTNKLPLIILPTVKKIGYASSLRLSLEKAKGEVVFFADAGGKHDPKDFWKLYKSTASYDLISGFKTNRKDPWYRLILAWGLNILVNLYFGVRFKDIDCGYKLMNTHAKKAILSEQWILKNNIALEVVLRAVYQGLKVKEVPIKHFSRRGESRGMPNRKIPGVIIILLSTFPKMKKQLLILKSKDTKRKMLAGYNTFFPSGRYREIWEGKISLIYKLPKYLTIIKNLLASAKKQTILEIGCGDGEIAGYILADKSVPIKSYTATELSSGGFQQTRKNLKDFKNIQVLQMDATNLEFKDKTFDTVCAFDVMHHVDNPKKMASEMVRVAKDKVVLIEANALSIPKRLAQLQPRYRRMNESSYYPWQYRQFFHLPRVQHFAIKPFLFMFPHCPSFLIPLNIFISETLEKIPLLNWQCSGVIIEMQLKK